jgi:hypothetical protein
MTQQASQIFRLLEDGISLILNNLRIILLFVEFQLIKIFIENLANNLARLKILIYFKIYSTQIKLLL